MEDYSDTVLQRILKWSKSRPDWQRDALRRIVKDGQPDEDIISEILALCKKNHGDQTVVADAVVLSEDHLPVDPGAGESISLGQISNVLGVNQLAAGQTLLLEPNGLTIIYGPNGTGKSGYTRILKKACRSRHAGEIIPDVYNSSPPGNASAELKVIRSDDRQEDVLWDNSIQAPEILSAITVFDRDAASVHVQKKKEVWFRPFGLDIPDDLASVCQELKRRLTLEKETLGERQNAVFMNPTWSDRSDVGKVLSNLKYDTDIGAMISTDALSDDEEARLNKLNSDLAQDPASAAASQRSYASNLEQVAVFINNIERDVRKTSRNRLIDLSATAVAERKVANTAANSAFSGLGLDGVGEVTWQNLWESARKYSATLEGCRSTFPPAYGETCLLCHQSIDEDAAIRMVGFEEFIKQDTERRASSAELAFEEAQRSFGSKNIHINKVSAAWRNLKLNNMPEAKHVIRFVVIARILQQQTLAILRGQEIIETLPLPTSPANLLIQMAADIRSYADTLHNSTDVEARDAVIKERDNLNDKKQVEILHNLASAEVCRLTKLDIVEKCLRETATTAITKLGNEIADDLITPIMRDRFQQEIGELAGNRVRVEVVRSGGKFGSPQYEVRLFANPKAKVQDILSEGEQTCVALASYLTELANASHNSALVFDDPVSSLDHKWRSRVAKRLVKEAGTRQIVVFTHDMIFVNDLNQRASKSNIPVCLSHLSRSQDAVGIVNADLPWTASSIRDRIDKLEKMARKAKKHHEEQDDEEYKKATGTFYSQLRASWERALEDIVFANVIMRHRDFIDTKGLRRVVALEETDVAVFKECFQKCCDFVDAHDPSRGHDSEPPEPPELIRDVQTLKFWSETLRSKMNGFN